MNRKKVIAALASVAALASLAACGGVKDGGAATGNTITVGTTDKITSLDPAGSYDNGSYAVQIQVFPFLYAQNYNTSELSPDIAADDGTWSADGTEFTVKLKKGLKFANGHDLTASDVKFSFDRIKKINDENGQFDAAVSPRVAKKKCPQSEVAGNANTFIFPDINAGNIGYKIAQRMGNFSAYGPILLGLNSPINDLSRGCTADEVYSMAIITAALADNKDA